MKIKTINAEDIHLNKKEEDERLRAWLNMLWLRPATALFKANELKHLSLFLPFKEPAADLGCFPKGTLIYDPNFEYVPIEKIKEIGQVRGCDGNLEKINSVYKRQYKGNLYHIKTLYGFNINVTEEHPFLSIRKQDVLCRKRPNKEPICNTNKNGRCSICNRKKFDNPIFIEAKNLKKGDYLAIPRNISSTYQNQKINISLAKFLGWYLAEGNIMYSHKIHIGGVNITLGIQRNEKYADEIKKMALELGATSVTLNRREKKSIIEVMCFGKDFGTLIYNLAGQYAHKKRLHPSVFNWSKEEHKALLQCYFLGDGHYRYNPRCNSYTVKSVSYKLIHQIRILFNKYGVCPSFSIEKRQNPKHKTCYSLVLCGKDVSFLRHNNSNYEFYKRKYKISKDYIFVPIINIKKEMVNMSVYNLNITNSHTYIANGLCVHNCGDGTHSSMICGARYHPDFDMYLSIKYMTKKKSKKNDKKIHFKTATEEEDYYRGGDPYLYFNKKDYEGRMKFIKKPVNHFHWGCDIAPTLCDKATMLFIYDYVTVQDLSKPLDRAQSNAYRTIYSNVTYWMKNKIQLFKEQHRILTDDGVILMMAQDRIIHEQIALATVVRNNLKKLGLKKLPQWAKEIDRGRIAQTTGKLLSDKEWRTLFKKTGFEILYHGQYMSRDAYWQYDMDQRETFPTDSKLAQELIKLGPKGIKLRREWKKDRVEHFFNKWQQFYHNPGNWQKGLPRALNFYALKKKGKKSWADKIAKEIQEKLK